MTGVSPLVGPVGTMQSLRTRSGIMEIRGRLSGGDGLAGNRMGADELRSVIFRDHNLAGRLVMDDLGAACKVAAASLSPDASEGCRVLVAWDRTSNADSAGSPLFREFWRKAKDIPKVWRVPFDPSRPIGDTGWTRYGQPGHARRRLRRAGQGGRDRSRGRLRPRRGARHPAVAPGAWPTGGAARRQ